MKRSGARTPASAFSSILSVLAASRSLALLVGLLALTAVARPASANFQYQVYAGTFDVLPNFTSLTPVASGQSTTISVSVTTRTDNFGLVFTNTLNAPTTGLYEFYTNSDDGSRLYIDGVLVVDNDGLHGPRVIQGSRQLTAGSHTLRVEFFEKTGGQLIEAGYRTGNPSFQPIPANGQLSYTSANESEFGSWGPVIQWPEIAISAANLPDGRVLSWSSTETNAFPSSSEFTHASVFDPATGTFVSVDNNFHDMFCAGLSTLENGTIVASGGNPSDRRTTAFNPATLSWTPLANMNDLRWYGANATLPNNTIFSTFAKDAGNRSEVYDPATNTWTPRPNATMQTLVTEQNNINAATNPTGALNLEWWAHIAVAPQGDVFQGGPTPTWHRFDPIGGAANVVLGQPIGNVARMYGNAITYGEGKVLLLGGADRRLSTPTSVNHVYRIDLNGPSPVVTPGAPMNYPRALLNSVTLPNGEVLVIGGNTVAKIFDDTGSVLPAEIYDPTTNTWRIVDSINIPRNYHSTALLLKDGRVLSAGGGACGSGCAANHLDGQIFSPPYLFESDDSPAVRPTLSVPVATQVSAGDQLVVTASPDTTSFSIVRLSATTHHLNTDQRFLPLVSTDNGDGTFTLTFPANPNVLIVGHYFLFALDADGTPSIGETIQVVRELAPPPDPNAPIYLSDLAWASAVNGWGPAERDRSNGETAAGDGGPLTLNGVVHPKGIGVHAVSEISVALNGNYDRFLSFIGLDDSRNGLCGQVRFQVALDGIVAYTSGSFVDTTPTGNVDLDVGSADTLTLRVLDDGGVTCGDHGDWADAKLIPKPLPGFRYYRFTPTQLRNDATANSVQLAELALFKQGVRQRALSVTNPGGNNPPGEGPTNADDANVATKWLDYNRGDLVYDFGVPVEIDGYSITTANDAAERDPVRWTLEASQDGVSWEVIDDQSGQNYPTPTARLTSTAVIPIVILDAVTPLPAAPRHSTTLIVETSSGADRIWNVNPDNDTVTVSSAAGTVLAQIPVGDRPWSLAKRPGSSRVFVTNKGSASISVIDTVSLAVDHTVPLPRGAQPHGLAFSADGAHYFVVLESLATLQKRQSSNDALVGSLLLSGRPRHVSMRADDTRLYVSNFITPPIPGESDLAVNVAGGGGQIFAVAPGGLTLVATIGLPHDGRGQTESQGPGMPNYVGPAVVSFDGQFAYVPSKKDNVRAGMLRGVSGMTFESTVRANTSRIVLASESEDPGFRVDHDNASVATGAALSGDDRYLFVTLETSRELAVYDTENGFQLMRLPTGRAPQSVALSSDGSIAYVHDFMDRTVSRFDLTEMLQTHLPATNLLAPIDVVTTETLSPEVLLGKQIFYDAADDRLSLDNYMSCATCHNDGDGDGRVWDLGAFGEGVRNTVDLRGKGEGHGLPHWSGNFDEIQDFEGQIRNLNLGLGLLTNPQFAATTDPLGAPKTGLSPDLDALAAYLESLTAESPSPYRPSAGSLSASAQLGRAAFAQNDCLQCHALPKLTDSPTGVRHDVGTIDAASGERLGGPLDGFDAPGLIGVWESPPYLHDGEAVTLEAAISAHDAFAGLAPATVTQLADFLREAESSDLGVFLDDDGDTTLNLEDPAPANPCIPTTFVTVCAQDSDGDGATDFQEGATADSDGDGLFDYQESSTADTDGDGTPNQGDAANGNACVPTAFVAACTQDSDGDGATDFQEGATADGDGDGLFDYQESSTADADGDGTPNQGDAANGNACVPTAFVATCAQDSDGDGASDFQEGATADSDGDGLLDYQESATADADGDGTPNQADAANANTCVPNAFVSVCAQDSDGDGATDFQEGATADSDGDGLFDYQESSTADADSDGTPNQGDAANGNACVPTAFVAACAQDSDGDGASDFQEGATADSDGDGLLDYQESATADADNDGTPDQGDAANGNACVPTAFVSVCTQDSDGDGATDFQEGATADSDGDGLLDYQESATADADSDGTADQADAANANTCVPNAFVSVCAQDSDGDGATDFQEGASADGDGDGLFDYQESSTADADGDGTPDQGDAANADACVPTAFVSVCAQDSDGDGTTDFQEGATADSDGDGLLDYQESATADADGDGTPDQGDAGNANACVPTAFVAACAQDSDGDGATDYQEGATADGDGDGLLDYQESSTADADEDGTPDQSDPENGNACVPDPEACAPAPQVPATVPLARILLAALLVATGLGGFRGRRSQ